jgi:hypothetical protein
MSWLVRFWRQESKPHRDFQIAYFLLALNFLIPSMVYLVSPERTYRSFLSIGQMLGETAPYPSSEDSYFWRFLGVSNVFALGFMCVLMLWDLRRFYAVLPALVTLKAGTALQFLGNFLFGLHHRAFLAIGLFDSLTCVAFVWFARRAYRSLATASGPHCASTTQ